MSPPSKCGCAGCGKVRTVWRLGYCMDCLGERLAKAEAALRDGRTPQSLADEELGRNLRVVVERDHHVELFKYVSTREPDQYEVIYYDADDYAVYTGEFDSLDAALAAAAKEASGG